MPSLSAPRPTTSPWAFWLAWSVRTSQPHAQRTQTGLTSCESITSWPRGHHVAMGSPWVSVPGRHGERLMASRDAMKQASRREKAREHTNARREALVSPIIWRGSRASCGPSRNPPTPTTPTCDRRLPHRENSAARKPSGRIASNARRHCTGCSPASSANTGARAPTTASSAGRAWPTSCIVRARCCWSRNYVTLRCPPGPRERDVISPRQRPE